MRQRSPAITLVVALASGGLAPGCSALGLFDTAPAVACLHDVDCRVPGLIEDSCVRYTCDPVALLCVGALADADQDGQAAIGCAESVYAPTGEATDCNDHDVAVFAGAFELCGGGDNDCDGRVDENCSAPALALGETHACYLAASTIVCWGSNGEGEIGIGVPDPVGAHPRRVQGLDGLTITSIAAGYETTCATIDDGRVFCWGNDDMGQLALPPPARRLAPTEVPALEGAHDLVLGTYWGCAIFGDEVRCWGVNVQGIFGTLGPDSATPTPVAGMTEVVELTGAQTAACALRANGELWCWGTGGAHACNTSTPDPCMPLATPGLTQVRSSGDHGCVLEEPASNVWCWGNNGVGQLGGMPDIPGGFVQVDGVSGAMSIATGEYHSCAVISGRMWCWGSNDDLQLGLADPLHLRDPVNVQMDVTDFASVSARSTYTCALRESGSPLCWGSNGAGQLGATTAASLSAAPQSPLTTWRVEGSR